jgi:transcriptional regulator with XRE-family HTH domain
MNNQQTGAFLAEVGDLLKQRREVARISQKNLSELTALSVHTISDIESGRGNPTLEVLHRLCTCLGLEIALRPRIIHPTK